ncbi:putative membrane protein [Salsuginibacillus halophilus]|uniref:Putative membrane protein n=1 Tax=Salsuginibacillus halophilus TaxID=517424 RepID=A0A2P8HG00_9BACI|nr:cell wall-active antibiotics response protein LiaF [Salsuginibacillus halophilus]PSL45147.1 putative membrane protein [Salsuginibacillus halophilus]
MKFTAVLLFFGFLFLFHDTFSVKHVLQGIIIVSAGVLVWFIHRWFSVRFGRFLIAAVLLPVTVVLLPPPIWGFIMLVTAFAWVLYAFIQHKTVDLDEHVSALKENNGASASLAGAGALTGEEVFIYEKQVALGHIVYEVSGDILGDVHVKNGAGSVYLDLSQATFASKAAYISVAGGFGGVEVILPSTLSCEVRAKSGFGALNVLQQKETGLQANIVAASKQKTEQPHGCLNVTVDRWAGDITVRRLKGNGG